MSNAAERINWTCGQSEPGAGSRVQASGRCRRNLPLVVFAGTQARLDQYVLASRVLDRLQELRFRQGFAQDAGDAAEAELGFG